MRTPSGSALNGHLEVFRPELVFQLIGMARLHGLLTLEHVARRCRVYFRNGEVVWADEVSGRAKPDASVDASADMLQRVRDTIDDVLQWQAGTFRFENGVRADHGDVLLETSLEQLLLESMTRRDERGGAAGA